MRLVRLQQRTNCGGSLFGSHKRLHFRTFEFHLVISLSAN